MPLRVLIYCMQDRSQVKSSALEIKGTANPQVCHSDGFRFLNVDLRGLGRDRKPEGGARFTQR